jgi:ABC-type glycerol-3-phosphate transport system permease component
MDIAAKVRRFLLYVVLFLLAVSALFPFFWMFATSFKTTYSLYEYPPQFIPKEPTLQNYIYIFTETPALLWLRNSIIVSFFGVSLNLFFNSLAAYPFAKKKFFGKNVAFVLILGLMMIPQHTLIVPVFVLFSRIGLVNTLTALIIPAAASPFGIFLLRQYMITLPDELLESAKIDGATEFGIYFRIVLPLVKPALSALAILVFLWTWNVLLWPLILITTSKMRTLTLGFATLQSEYLAQYGLVMAGATVIFLPALVIFILLQKYFVEGIALTGLKA